jgi:hypothetical protein
MAVDRPLTPYGLQHQMKQTLKTKARSVTVIGQRKETFSCE